VGLTLGDVGLTRSAIEDWNRDSVKFVFGSLTGPLQNRSAISTTKTTAFNLKRPNAGGEPRPMAGATQERRLLGVGSTA